MPKYRYTDPETKRTWVTDSKLSQDELDEAFGEHVPPLSKTPEPAPFQDPVASLVSKARPTIARIVPAVTGAIVGGPVGGAIGSGVGAYLGAKAEGRDAGVGELAVQTALGGVAPGAGGTLAKGIAKGAAYGFASETLDSISKGEGIPPVGNMALGALIGGAFLGGLSKLHTRSALREVLPTPVADETHSALTSGKLATATTEDLSEELGELKYIRKLHVGRVGSEVIEDKVRIKYRPEQGVKKKGFTVLSETGTPKVELKGLKQGGGESPVDFPIPEPTDKLKGGTASLSRYAPKIWVYDRIQKQTGVPVYDQVYRPIKDAVESGDRELIDNTVKEIRRKFLPHGKGAGYDPTREIIEHTLSMASGHRDGVIQSLEYTMKDWARRLPLVGREISDETARRWASNSISLQYAGLLAGRGDPLIQNSAQTLQTGYAYLGGRWYGKGIAQAFTKEGYAKAVQMGALTPEHSVAEELPKATTLYTKAVDLGFRLYRKVDDMNNAIMFLGQYNKTLNAARRAKGNVKNFINYANLNLGIPEAETAAIARMYASGDIKGAAQKAGIMRASVTQFMYGKTERPQALTSTVGRVVGGFGNWGAFYSNLIKETMTGPAPVHKKALFATRWIGANVALGYGLANVYGAINSKNPDRRAWGNVLIGPLVNGLGPLVDVYQGEAKAFYKLSTGDVAGAGKQAAKSIVPVIPFYGAGQEWYRRLGGRE